MVKHPAGTEARMHPRPARTPHQQVSMTPGGDEEEVQFNNPEAASVSQMESPLPLGWRRVGVKTASGTSWAP